MAQPALVQDYPPPRIAAAETIENPAIAVESVTRSYGDHQVIQETSFAIKEGEIFGLIGPSGSGKTTLMKLLVGLSVPSSGRILVRGKEPANFATGDRERIGYVPQQFVLYPSLTVEQNARFVAGLYGIGWFKRRRRIREVLQMVDLWNARKRLARNTSGGMQRRLTLACALLHSPRTLFIDEPTAGLDPQLRARIWEHLEQLRHGGATILVTTQNLDDAANCDRVALLRGGHIVALGTPDDLRKRAVGGDALDIEADTLQRVHLENLRYLPGVRGVITREWGSIRVIVDDAATATALVTDWMRDQGVRIDSIRAHEPSFDEAFLALVEGPERDVA